MSKKWQFQRSNGEFADYDDNTQKLIQDALSRNDKIAIISHNNTKYYIDFATGCQTHYPPGSGGCVRRTKPPVGYKKPEYLNNKQSKKVYSESYEEYNNEEYYNEYNGNENEYNEYNEVNNETKKNKNIEHQKNVEKEDENDEEDSSQCPICMDKNKSHALSCGHIYCEDCVSKLKKCSFCNKDVTSIIKLFNLN
eukprot:446877_1